MTYISVCLFRHEMEAGTEQRITLRKLAELCELAPTTVSSILHGRKTYCSQAKIERVKSLVKEYNYRPNIGYNIMTGRETNIIAVVFSQKRVTQHEMLRNLYMNICVGLNERNYAMYTAILTGDDEEQMSMLRSLEERGCRAFLFIGTPKNFDGISAYLKSRDLRFIGFNNSKTEDGIFADQSSAYIRYLDILELGGRTNIRFALTKDYMENTIFKKLSESRRLLYRDACMNVPHDEYVQGNSASHYYQRGYQQAKDELRRNSGLEALIFPTDYHVLGAAAAIADAGRSPDAVELFGMDDAASVCFTKVRMTTTRFDMDSIAEKLIERIVTPVSGIEIIPGEIVHYPIA